MTFDLPVDPWAALALKRGTVDRKAVRRAYAAALRAHPPEDDAAAFRRVRDAYETLSQSTPEALRWLAEDLADEPIVASSTPQETALDTEVSTSGWMAEADESAPPNPTNDVRAIEDLIRDASARLDEALAAPPGERTAPLRGRLRSIWQAASASPAARDALVWRVLDAYGPVEQGIIAEALPRLVIREGLQMGDAQLTLWAARALARTGRDRSLQGLGSLVLTYQDDLSHAGAAYELAELAAAVAVLQPALASRLLDSAYDIATPRARRGLDDGQVDALMRVGHEVAYWKRDARALVAWIAEVRMLPTAAPPSALKSLASSRTATFMAPHADHLLLSFAPTLSRRTPPGLEDPTRIHRRKYRTTVRPDGEREREMSLVKVAVFIAVCIALTMIVGRVRRMIGRSPHEEDVFERLRERRGQSQMEDEARRLRSQLREISGERPGR